MNSRVTFCLALAFVGLLAAPAAAGKNIRLELRDAELHTALRLLPTPAVWTSSSPATLARA